ncbi:tumor endothelial marker 7 precursor-like protein [Dinothrombium tinctorium]|uniref:Tumor endothelial marker 7-like protein n=1 Tax=Dinothrombium tinctorium TaxID=1965070 RepID=A0A3S3P7H8_9ACAR|nr:tumor endothelial marker 7 precursor-like protein [Dinothrombium tinctorium]
MPVSTASSYSSASGHVATSVAANITNETEGLHDINEYNTSSPNSTISIDTHTYYNSTFYTDPKDAMKFWVDLSQHSKTITNEMLSNSHRRAVTVHLNFTFPFYGHSLTNVTIATGGFCFVGETVHSSLAATQYIAPLMANFDTSMNKSSVIQYMDNGTALVVQWNNVMLQNDTKHRFSFQATMFNTGDIVFVYKDIPIQISEIPDTQHPVKVGISDAYVIESSLLSKQLNDVNEIITLYLLFLEFIRRKTIYEYHRIDFKKFKISNRTAIYFTPLQTPNEHQKSEQHTSQQLHYKTDLNTEKKSSGDKAGLISVLVVVALALGVSMWVYYAYKNPQSSSGQFLIKYRPSQWRWGGSEARYTAASIHM